MFAKAQRVHFIGIGGIGMSGIAEILLTLGYAVSGSDLRRSSITDRLGTLGATVFQGHAAANVVGSGVVVTSSAVNEQTPRWSRRGTARYPSSSAPRCWPSLCALNTASPWPACTARPRPPP